MEIPPCHYNDHREYHLHTVSAGYHSVCADDLQREPWRETCHVRGRRPMGNTPHADTFEYRWEEPTSFRRYRSVTPTNHGVSAYGPEASSPMEAYLSAPMESHCNPTYGWQATPNGPLATAERVRSLISVYGQQTHPRRHAYQSPEMDKHTHFEISVHGSEAFSTRVFPSDATELAPTPSISAHEQEVSPPFRMHRPSNVENLLHCCASACVPEAPMHMAPRSLTSQSTSVDSKVYMVNKENSDLYA
jgi:poly(rC)-binding protein 3/4